MGWFPTVVAMGSINLYPIIRDINIKLPPEDWIKVWLGDPSIDWSQIKSKADWDPLEAQRDSYPADLILREILSKNKKALVIYGTGHFGIFPGKDNMRALLDRARPGALFVVSPFIGYADETCAAQLGKFSRDLPVPTLLAPVRGTSLEIDLYRPGCDGFPRLPGMNQPHYDARSQNDDGLNADALLYLGPRSQMMRGPLSLDMYRDSAYRAELERRFRLRTGRRLVLIPADNAAVARPYWE